MKLSRNSNGKYVITVFAALILISFVCYRWPAVPRNLPTTLSPAHLRAERVAPRPRPVNGQSQTAAQPGAVNGPGARLDKDFISEGTALAHLQTWVKRREGKSAEIVQSAAVYDLNGRAVGLNVIVTTSSNTLSEPALQMALKTMTTRESAGRRALLVATQKGDIAGVNRQVSEFELARQKFIGSHELSCYKLSLSKGLPPVLAFWSGLPFEWVRQGDAQKMASVRLGTGASLQGLLRYTSVAALLCFTNPVGDRVYIDPVQMAEVPSQTFQTRSPVRRDTNDAGRESRIANQWNDFLDL